MPTLPPRNERRHEGPQRVDHTPEVDVQDPLPVLLTGVEKGPGDANPSVGHHEIRHPVLSKHMLSKPSGGSAIGHIKLKREPGSSQLNSSLLSSIKVNVNTQDVDTLTAKLKRGSPPNSTTSTGNEGQLPTHGRRRTINPAASKLPSGRAPANVVNKLSHDPRNNLGPIPHGPVPSNNFPPPQALTPRLSRLKERGGHKRILGQGNLLNRHRSPLRAWPRQPPRHIGPVQLNPVTSIPVASVKLGKQPRRPPHKFRNNRHLKRPDVPGMQQLSNDVPPPPNPHPGPDVIKIRPRNGGVRGKKPPQLRIGNRGPSLNRPPVMSNEVHRLIANGPHDSHKIIHQLRDQIAVPRVRRPRLPTPTHVIPNNPKPRSKLRNHPIPNGRIVRIPVDKHHNRPASNPLLPNREPHPTRHNPPSTHEVTVARTPQNHMR